MIPRIAATLFAALLAAAGVQSAKPNPTEAARLNNLGCAYMDQQLFEKGLKNFQDALAADPSLSAARLNEGVAYLNLQKMDEAKAALEDAAKADAKSPYAWYNLGLLYKNTGDVKAAIDAFGRVSELAPADPDTWYFLGTVNAQARQFPQAIEAFQRALQINPLHASAEFGLARAYQQSADTDHARDHLKKFQYITEKKLGAPLSLAYGEQGQYSRAVESLVYVIKPPAQIKVQFVDVTKEAGIVSNPLSVGNDAKHEGLGTGACFIDYDADGKIDLFLADDGPKGGMGLYHNMGNGKYEEATKEAGLDSIAHALSCTAGDYDNDGYADLAISSFDAILLLHNEKNGTFKNVAATSGIKGVGIDGVAFIDYDHDGDLDLYGGSGMIECIGICKGSGTVWRNNGDESFTVVDIGIPDDVLASGAIGTDYNNDRAVDLVIPDRNGGTIFQNPREGKFLPLHTFTPGASQAVKNRPSNPAAGVSVLDFDHDGWMDVAFTHMGAQALTLWRNNHGKSFDRVALPETNWVRAFGIAAFDYDNDGWVDLVAVGETKDGKGEIKLFRNLGVDGFKDVTADVGLDKIQLKDPRALITGDYDNDGATDLLITQNHGSAVLLKNVGGNKNHWMRLALKGLADNKSAIGTKVEIFSGGNRQKYEIYGSNGYLGQNSPYLTVGLGDAKEADIVRMLWPTGVLQDEIQVAGDRQQDFTEIDRRGSSCPTLFVWDGERYRFVADMLGAGVVGHWIGPNQRDIPRPVEWIKVPHELVQEKILNSVHEKTLNACHPEAGDSGPRDLTTVCGDDPVEKPCDDACGTRLPAHRIGASGDVRSLAPASPPLRMTSLNVGKLPTTNSHRPTTSLSFRFMEPLEEAVYLDQVRLLAVDHPAGVEVYPNEYFASNPPYPEFKVVMSRNAKPPAGAWDEHGHDVLPSLLVHKYFGDFALTQFQGFAQPHMLTLDLGEAYRGGPLWLLMHGEVEYFSANSMYAASQAGVQAIAPFVEAQRADRSWQRVVEDMGFPAGGPRTMTADLTGKLPAGTRKIRITTNLQVYWDSILVSRTEQSDAREIPRPAKAGIRDDAEGGYRRNAGIRDVAGGPQLSGRHSERSRSSGEAKNLGCHHAEVHLTPVPLARAQLAYHGYPLKTEGKPPGNVQYEYEKVSATGPYTRPAGNYTRYGDLLPLLTATDDKLAVFGSGDEVQLDFDAANLPALHSGWVRDYFFAAIGYEKDMDFYAAQGDYVAPLPFLSMENYPYAPKESFPLDDSHANYLLEFNTRSMSGNEQRGYWFDYGEHK